MSDETRLIHGVVYVHVLAPFKCERCGGDCHRLTNAPYFNGVIGKANRPPVEIVCNTCERAGRDAEAEERRMALKLNRERKAWKPSLTEPTQ